MDRLIQTGGHVRTTRGSLLGRGARGTRGETSRQFYCAVLGWRIDKVEPGFVTLYPGEGVGYVAVQSSPGYVPPVWPAEDGQQQMMLHIDVEVSDLEAAVDHAVEHGARVAAYQPQEQVRVMLDPAGHPFCLYVDTGD